MPATKVQLIGGQFQDSEGNVLALGYLLLKLNQDAQITGVGQVCAGLTVLITLNSSGAIDTGTPQLVWGTDQMTPVNAYYRVTGYKANGQLAWGPNNQQVTGSGGTFDVGTWVPNNAISWFPPVQALRLQVNEVPNVNQSLFDLKDSASVTFTDEGNGSVHATATAGTSIGLAPPTWWGSFEGGLYAFSTQLGGQYGTLVANQIKCSMVRLPYDIKISKISTLVNGSVGGGAVAGFGYYTTAGAKIFSWDNIPVSANGIQQITLGSPVTIAKGVYFAATGLSTTAAAASQCGYEGGHSSEGIETWNVFGTVRGGNAANPMVAGAMPATLGAIAAGGNGMSLFPHYFMEPS